MAAGLPRWVDSDHLTALALASMTLTGISYPLARRWPAALLLAVAGLALNWFGDSLDGTLARLRHRERPRFGFYVDHVVDCLGAALVLMGLASSEYMTPTIAMGLLIAYLMLSIDIYLATYCRGVFTLSFWGIGPTELRLVLAAGTLALRSNPHVAIFGTSYRLFDVGGVVASVGLTATLAISVVKNIQVLYREEPLP
jgi:phosphatidylglycerophosphate synthase